MTISVLYKVLMWAVRKPMIKRVGKFAHYVSCLRFYAVELKYGPFSFMYFLNSVFLRINVVFPLLNMAHF